MIGWLGSLPYWPPLLPPTASAKWRAGGEGSRAGPGLWPPLWPRVGKEAELEGEQPQWGRRASAWLLVGRRNDYCAPLPAAPFKQARLKSPPPPPPASMFTS